MTIVFTANGCLTLHPEGLLPSAAYIAATQLRHYAADSGSIPRPTVPLLDVGGITLSAGGTAHRSRTHCGGFDPPGPSTNFSSISSSLRFDDGVYLELSLKF